VKYAEIRMAVRPTSHAPSFIVRLCISNDAGYILNMNIYKEVADPATGVLKFVSFGPDQVGFFSCQSFRNRLPHGVSL
jgi:hypothetical protein